VCYEGYEGIPPLFMAWSLFKTGQFYFTGYMAMHGKLLPMWMEAAMPYVKVLSQNTFELMRKLRKPSVRTDPLSDNTRTQGIPNIKHEG
jgi:hypothetical protein